MERDVYVVLRPGVRRDKLTGAWPAGVNLRLTTRPWPWMKIRSNVAEAISSVYP